MTPIYNFYLHWPNENLATKKRDKVFIQFFHQETILHFLCLKKCSLKLHNLHWIDARKKAFMQTKQTYIGLYAETSKSIDVPKWQKQNTGNCKSCHALFKHYCSYKYSKVHDLVLLLFQSGALICKSLGPIFLQNWLAQIVRPDSGFPLSRDFSNFQVLGLLDFFSPGTTGPSRFLGPVLSSHGT